VSASIAIQVHTSPKPNSPSCLFGDVLDLGVGERPDLVALDQLAGQAPQGAVLVLAARHAQVHQKLADDVLCRTVTRTVGRMLMPSTRHEFTCPLRSVLNRFIVTMIRRGIITVGGGT